MSSLTTMSSSMDMEEPLEPQELVDTRLSLVIGAGGRPPPPSPPVQALLAQAQDQSAGRKRKRGSGGRPHSKIRTRTTMHGGNNADADHDEGRDGGGGVSKKLRLTGDQAALLEHSFRAHSIISHDEKHDLARRVGLRPRQVEVWFQNRRARTKLKQTELDRELLRRWCERLSGENARLRREIADLRSSSAASSLATTAACPSCSKLAAVV